jgi:hypothetical protein
MKLHQRHAGSCRRRPRLLKTLNIPVINIVPIRFRMLISLECHTEIIDIIEGEGDLPSTCHIS